METIKKITAPWYIAGLHFACQQCGRCCSGPDEGVIWISKPEIDMLADFLGQSVRDVRKKHLRRFGFRYSIRENPCSKDCVFLVSINQSKGCAIYDVRPMQCRSWPFWPSNLQSPDDWNAAARKCPGINKGKLYTFDEIEKTKNENAGGRIICDKVAQIYDWLDENIKNLDFHCSACGKCCNFDSFGHRLFVSSPEMVYFCQKNKILPMPGPKCPYQKDNKCTVYRTRFAGCRIFSCTGNAESQNALSEEALQKFKSICERFALPYLYTDLAKALNQTILLK